MKFSCMKDKLENAIVLAERFTGKKTNLPILANILLESNATSLQLTATNLESAVQIDILGKGSGVAKTSIPAKILSAFLQTLDEEKIDLEWRQNSLSIRSASRGSKINSMPVDEFPLIPKIQAESRFSLDAHEFQKGIEKVLPAVSLSEFKPELAGVLLRISGPILTLAATDTFRLSEKTIPLIRQPDEDEVSCILPGRIAGEMMRLATFGDEFRFTLGGGQMLLECGEVKMISRLVDGVFPDYKAIIPKNFETSGSIRREELRSTIRASSIFSSKLHDVCLRFDENTIDVTSQNDEIGEYETRVPAFMSGREATVRFNYRYLLDGLNALDEEEIFFGLSGETTPALLRNKNDASFVYLVMPIRLS